LPTIAGLEPPRPSTNRPGAAAAIVAAFGDAIDQIAVVRTQDYARAFLPGGDKVIADGFGRVQGRGTPRTHENMGRSPTLDENLGAGLDRGKASLSTSHEARRGPPPPWLLHARPSFSHPGRAESLQPEHEINCVAGQMGPQRLLA